MTLIQQILVAIEKYEKDAEWTTLTSSLSHLALHSSRAWLLVIVWFFAKDPERRAEVKNTLETIDKSQNTTK